jgi:hypothetical protein
MRSSSCGALGRRCVRTRVAGPLSPWPPPFAPQAPPPVSRLCSPASPLLWRSPTSHARSSCAPALRAFRMRTRTAHGLWSGVRPPRFRRDPFVRDVALDPGRATAPRVTAPPMLPSTDNSGSAPAIFRISWLNPTPHTIAVYASPLPSPTAAQHSLAGGRYPLPAPDFHRLDRASFAWRTLSSCSAREGVFLLNHLRTNGFLRILEARNAPEQGEKAR